MATKCGNRYQSRIRLPNGKRLAGYGKTPEEADADLASKLEETNTLSTAILSQKPTLHDVAKALWFPRVQMLRHLSQKKYTGSYIKWIRPTLGHVLVDQVTSAHVQGIINRINQNNSSSLATFVKGMLVQILECACREGYVNRNVAKFVKAPRRMVKRERALDPEDALELLRSFDGTPLSAPVFFALILGMRRGEICGLKWEDLDRQTGQLHVVRQLQAMKGHGVIEEELKTATSRRTLRLPRKLIDEIDRRGDLDSEYICTYGGERWVPNTLGRIWSENVPPQIEGWTFHDLRHGAAGLLYAGGCDLFEIAAVLGHKHPGMAALYTSITERRMTEAMKAIENMWA